MADEAHEASGSPIEQAPEGAAPVEAGNEPEVGGSGDGYVFAEEFAYRDPAEEARQREAAHWERLESGRAIRESAAERSERSEALAELGERYAGIASDEAIDEIIAAAQPIAEQYGPEVALSAGVIERLYAELGGDERFAPDPVQQQYEQALTGRTLGPDGLGGSE